PGWHGRLYEEVKNEILDSAEFIQCETGVMIYKLFSTLQRMACGVKSIDDEYEDLYPNALDNPRIKDLLWHINRIPNDEQVICGQSTPMILTLSVEPLLAPVVKIA